MRVFARYSHLNGEEFLLIHHRELWEEILEVIESVDAEACRTKESKEKGREGKLLYSPGDMNKTFKAEFNRRGWRQGRQNFWTTSDARIVRRTIDLPPEIQKTTIEESGHEAISSYNQTDFVKERIAVEVQFGKYSFVAHDLFVKHMTLYTSDVIDVGIEILPMKEMGREMSLGVPYYERDLLNVIRQGRGIPAVPLVLIGVAP